MNATCPGGRRLQMVAGLAGCFEGDAVVRAGGHVVAEVEEGQPTRESGDAGAIAEQP